MALAVPMIIVWVFGSQILILVILIMKRKELKSEDTKKYFAILYQGLKGDRFYWEFVNTLRKTLLVMVDVFLAQFSTIYKTLCAISMLVVMLRIQLSLQPYKLKINNECETLSMMAILLTIFGGVVFINDSENITVVQILALVAIISINLFFVLFWMYLMSMTYKYKITQNFSAILKIVLMRGQDDQVFTETDISLSSALETKAIHPKKRKQRTKNEKQEKSSGEQTTRRKLDPAISANSFNLKDFMKRADEDSFYSIAPNASVLQDNIFGRHKLTNSLNESKYMIEEEESMDVQLQGQDALN